MKGVIREQELLAYIGKLRNDLGLPETRSCFFGWDKPYLPVRDKIVEDAPEILGHIVQLLYEVRQALSKEGFSTKRGGELAQLCGEIRTRFDEEFARYAGRRRRLELRSNGKIVRRKPIKAQVKKICGGPDSS